MENQLKLRTNRLNSENAAIRKNHENVVNRLRSNLKQMVTLSKELQEKDGAGDTFEIIRKTIKEFIKDLDKECRKCKNPETEQKLRQALDKLSAALQKSQAEEEKEKLHPYVLINNIIADINAIVNDLKTKPEQSTTQSVKTAG